MKKELDRLQEISLQNKDWGIAQAKRDTSRHGMAANHQFLGSVPLDLMEAIEQALVHYGVEPSLDNVYKILKSRFPQYLMQGTNNSIIRVN